MKIDLDHRYFIPPILPEDEINPPVSDTLASYVVYEPKKPSGELVVLTPAWHNGEPHYTDLAERAASRGKHVIKFLFGDDILSGDPERSLRNHQLAGEYVVDVVRKVQQADKFRSTHLVTSSLGGIAGMWAVEHGMSIDKVTNITFADTLADCIAEGIRTQHLWQHMQSNGWTIKELRHYLHELAPATNAGRTRDKHVVCVLSPSDEVIPYWRGLNMINVYKDVGANVRKVPLPFLGHYFTIGAYYMLGRP